MILEGGDVRTLDRHPSAPISKASAVNSGYVSALAAPGLLIERASPSLEVVMLSALLRPMAGNVPFLMKDVVLLAVPIYLLKQDLVRVSASAKHEARTEMLRA